MFQAARIESDEDAVLVVTEQDVRDVRKALEASADVRRRDLNSTFVGFAPPRQADLEDEE
jgi:hypothetical protein